MLTLLWAFLFPPVRAKENTLLSLLNLPAPAPPNPLVASERKRDDKFYDKDSPPKDNAPIAEILDYWKVQDSNFRELGYNPKPSDRTAERIRAEIEKDHELLSQFLNVLPDGERWANFVKDIYDREGTNGKFERGTRSQIKKWLTFHSSFFSSDLSRIAERAGETNEYVSNQEELLALARVDFDRAEPILRRLYGDSSQRVSQVLARWGYYRHAMETGSTGDAERFRDELKAIVEDRSATAGMRDLALDALCKEKEWNGRDDWYYSLLGDETLAELKVNGQTYTGLTTLLYYAADDKYIPKMLELVRSDNPTIRGNAIRNLLLKLNTHNIEIVRALLPWLDDPKWADDRGGSRSSLIGALAEFEIPESVPGLIRVLDEKPQKPTYAANRPANSVDAANAANMVANAVANVANSARVPANSSAYTVAESDYIYNPIREMTISALARQKDARAVPSLRRLLPDSEGYQQSNIIRAILACHGFSIPEQIDALELAAKGMAPPSDTGGQEETYLNANAPAAYARPKRAPTAAEIKLILGRELMNGQEISDDLARAVVDRIEVHDQRNKPLAASLRKIILKWQNAAINLLLLRDTKRGIADSETLVRLLAQRKTLREQQSTDIFDIKTGSPIALGMSACLLEDTGEAAALLEGGDAESRTTLLACARLIRMPLAVDKVAENLRSTMPILVTAAERYLESEDSPEARAIILARHPGEAMILGAMSAFFPEGVPETSSETLWMLYQSVGDSTLYDGWYGSGNDEEIKQTEKRLQDEVKKDADLIGIYAYDRNYVRIYKNRVIFSWDEDDSRYRERPLTTYEFEDIKSYVTTNRLDVLPAFLGCGGDYCTAKELIMLGKAGGRRVYVSGGPHPVFSGLENVFATLKQTPAALKYGLGREIPGLEIVFASDDLHVETVWKSGTDLRVAASESAVRKKVKAEIENTDDDAKDENGDAENYEAVAAKAAAETEKRRYEGFAWYRIANGTTDGIAAQPAEVEFIPPANPFDVNAEDEQWKARAPGIEIRTSDDGLFKIVRGRLTKVRSGTYSFPVLTPNGRWVVVQKANDDSGGIVVRIDLLTGREYKVEIEGYGDKVPAAYVASLNKVLVVRDYGEEYGDYGGEGEDADTAPDDDSPESMMLVDPLTGSVQPIAGEFRPLSQQTFRPLQKAAKPNEFWAAMPDAEKHETRFGIYDARTLSFRQMMRIPKIKFNSMDMWVDEPGGKVYFVYRGHLLALPLNQGKP
jgi:hypothetical protein